MVLKSFRKTKGKHQLLCVPLGNNDSKKVYTWFLFLYKNQYNFYEAQCSYFLKISIFRIFLFCFFIFYERFPVYLVNWRDIEHFNTTLEEYEVINPDKTSICFGKYDFYGVQVFLLQVKNFVASKCSKLVLIVLRTLTSLFL